MTLNEKQIREIIREELQNFQKENEKNINEANVHQKNFDEKNLAKKTEIITTSIAKTILYWIAIILLTFYGMLLSGVIIAKIIEFFINK